jgi:hypothetical protein
MAAADQPPRTPPREERRHLWTGHRADDRAGQALFFSVELAAGVEGFSEAFPELELAEPSPDPPVLGASLEEPDVSPLVAVALSDAGASPPEVGADERAEEL